MAGKNEKNPPNPDAIAEADKALSGAGDAGGPIEGAHQPPTNAGQFDRTRGRANGARSELAKLGEGRSEKVLPDRRPRLGDKVIYVLGPASQRAGEFRTATISFVWKEPGREGVVNLVWLLGRHDDAPKGNNTGFLSPGCEYDPTGKPGTWHVEDDDPDERPVGRASRAEMAAAK